jgi:hypothetical protein
MKYPKYRYIFPPRPKNAVPQSELFSWDNGSMVAQPKLNGSNATIYTNGLEIFTMNRHGDRLTRVEIKSDEILSLYKGTGGWSAFNGEYMNKSKYDENKKVFNHKFVIFDILINDGDYLIGKTVEQRVQLLDQMFGKNSSEKEYLYSISENIYRVKSYENEFNMLFDKFTGVDMLEGLVLKRKNARLEMSGSELNNMKWQIKCRKPTLNYKF